MAAITIATPRHRAAHRRPRRTGAGRTVLTALQAAVIALLAATVLAILVPGVFGWQALVVRSGSMGATAPTGSVVLARPVPGSQVAVGDVVVMRHATSGLPVMHRVIQIDQAGGQRIVHTKGDANPAPDPELYVLPAEATVSVLAIPRLGYLIGYLQTPLGRWVMVGLAGLLMMSAAIRRSRGTDASPLAQPA